MHGKLTSERWRDDDVHPAVAFDDRRSNGSFGMGGVQRPFVPQVVRPPPPPPPPPPSRSARGSGRPRQCSELTAFERQQLEGMMEDFKRDLYGHRS